MDEVNIDSSSLWSLFDNDLELITLFLRGRGNIEGGSEFMMQFALFPFQEAKNKFKTMHEFLTEPPLDLIDIKSYLGNADSENKFSSVEELRADKRSTKEITEFLYKSES